VRFRISFGLILAVAVLAKLAHAQVILTDDANTSAPFPKKNFGGSVALIVCNGTNTYIKFNFANLGPSITGVIIHTRISRSAAFSGLWSYADGEGATQHCVASWGIFL